MISIRRSHERGYEDKGWLQTFHTFSFDTYYDPKFLGYHSLFVLNEEIIKGGKGLGAHAHRDVEIVTYVIEGVIEQQDSMGNTNLIRQDEIQRMSAGTGITHSEYNLSHQAPAHFIQFWIHPENHGLEPSYAQKIFAPASKWGQWCLMLSRNGRNGSIRIHQDLDLYGTQLDQKDEITFEGFIDRNYWIQIISGEFKIHETYLKAGDGAALTEVSSIEAECIESGEFLLFDLA